MTWEGYPNNFLSAELDVVLNQHLGAAMPVQNETGLLSDAKNLSLSFQS